MQDLIRADCQPERDSGSESGMTRWQRTYRETHSARSVEPSLINSSFHRVTGTSLRNQHCPSSRPRTRAGCHSLFDSSFPRFPASPFLRLPASPSHQSPGTFLRSGASLHLSIPTNRAKAPPFLRLPHSPTLRLPVSPIPRLINSPAPSTPTTISLGDRPYVRI